VNTDKNLITGVISTTAKGAGFMDYEDPKLPSLYFEPGTLNTALNKDTVEAKIAEKTIRGVKQQVGEVIRIIERAKDTFVGVVDLGEQNYIVIPDDKKMYVNIMIPKAGAPDLKKDDKVFVKLNPWTDPNKNPTGSVVKILGRKGDNNVEMESIVLDKGFEIGFPPAVEKEADEIEKNKVIGPDEIAKRRDMRTTPTFTIDPFDAKDFDDAVSFKELKSEDLANLFKTPATGALVNGDTDDTSGKLYEIGVHIADVSHYVREGTALDAEAVKRGCSIYLVDRTIPMLPEALSNDVCSLNPQEDKLTFSAIFVINEKADIITRWFGRTVMNSTHRFTYETAQAVIDNDPSLVEKYSSNIQTAASAEAGMKYRDSLVTLNALAKIFQKEKFLNGAIEFEQEEVKFKLDATGKPIGVYRKERLDTHKLVEEYMLLANREVAKFIFDQMKEKGGRDTGAIYRIHDVPDKERIEDLEIFVKALGYELPNKGGVVTAHDINHLLEQVEGTPHESLIRTAAIRSMQKAVYSTKNIGHFGLAFDFYTHFTSPIRRYPDLLVHRVLHKHIMNLPFGDRDAITLQRIAESSTRREIDAAGAERASNKLKQVEYMSTHIGEVFTGTISGVSRGGLFVEENETKSEGMISIRSLGTDFYVFNEKTYSIVGEKSRELYTMGDQIKFKVISADLDKKMLEYQLVR
jgi:ribonuclease R